MSTALLSDWCAVEAVALVELAAGAHVVEVPVSVVGAQLLSASTDGETIALLVAGVPHLMGGRAAVCTSWAHRQDDELPAPPAGSWKIAAALVCAAGTLVVRIGTRESVINALEG